MYKLNIKKLLKYIPLLIIKFYQYCIRPFIPSACRYTPSCSEYGIQAINKHGAFKGSWLSLKRIFRCHPWGGNGFDPVP